MPTMKLEDTWYALFGWSLGVMHGVFYFMLLHSMLVVWLDNFLHLF